MNIFLITYDLIKPGRNYSALFDEIKKSGLWWHHLDSVWLIETGESAVQVHNRLIRHLDKNDHLFIIEVRRNFQGWLPNSAWEWLNSMAARGSLRS